MTSVKRHTGVCSELPLSLFRDQSQTVGVVEPGNIQNQFGRHRPAKPIRTEHPNHMRSAPFILHFQPTYSVASDSIRIDRLAADFLLNHSPRFIHPSRQHQCQGLASGLAQSIGGADPDRNGFIHQICRAGGR